MKNYESLSHTRYDCKYHVVFIPKYRRKKIYGAIRRHLGEIFHELAKQKESRILEGHLKGDHVHRCISIPPKFAVSSVVGFMKGKSAISVLALFAVGDVYVSLCKKKALTLHLARGEGRERYFGCNLMQRKVLASSYQHLMAEAPSRDLG